MHTSRVTLAVKSDASELTDNYRNISDEFEADGGKQLTLSRPTGDTCDSLVRRIEIASWPAAVVSLPWYHEHGEPKCLSCRGPAQRHVLGGRINSQLGYRTGYLSDCRINSRYHVRNILRLFLSNKIYAPCCNLPKRMSCG